MLLKLFYFYIFIDASRLQELIPFLGTLKIQKIIIAILLLGIFFSRDFSGIWQKRFSGQQSKALLILSMLMVVTVPFSVWPGGSINFLTESYWKTLVYFFLIGFYISDDKNVDNLISAHVLGAGLLCIFSLKFAGSGRLEFLQSYDANEMAAFLVVSLPFAFWKMITSKGIMKYLSLFICILIVIVVVRTQSRGAFLGMFILAVVISGQMKLYTGRFPFKAVLSILIVSIGIFFYFGGTDYLNRISTIINYKEDYNISTEEGRFAVWKKGLQLFADSPVLGVGVNMYSSAFGESNRGEGKWSAAHNSFLQVAVELGLFGFLIYMYLIISTIRRLKEFYNKKDKDDILNVRSAIAFSCYGGFTAFCVTGFFLSLAYGGIFIFLLSASYSFIQNNVSKSSVIS